MYKYTILDLCTNSSRKLSILHDRGITLKVFRKCKYDSTLQSFILFVNVSIQLVIVKQSRDHKNLKSSIPTFRIFKLIYFQRM